MIFMVLTYISPIDDVEHLFIGLLAICISPLETSLFRFLCPSFSWVMCLFTVEL